MKTLLIRMIAAAALVVPANVVAAQTPDLLNTLEVQRLAAAEAPADHARLSRHFAAVAEVYENEAVRHRAFADGVVGNPNRRFAADAGAKWARLAETAREAAVTARGLAHYHGQLAAGFEAAAPAGAGPFHGGKGAPEPTEFELRVLAAQARTPTDHFVLEEYYRVTASREEETIRRHVAMAQGFRGAPRRTGSGDAGVHCDRVIKEARHAAERALVNAMIHRQLAYIDN